jgi:nucleoside-diphosphate-sugar epimerase
MNILLTGGTGFIGQRLVRRLALQGHEVGLLVRRSSMARAKPLFADLPKVTFVEADITQADVVTRVAGTEALLEGVDAVVHLAGVYDLAIPLAKAYLHNVVGTQNLVRFARRLPRLSHFHHVSTYAVNAAHRGHAGEDLLDPNALLPDHYAATKRSAEAIVRQADWGKTHVRIYRPGVVVGDSRTGQMDKVDGPYYFFRLFQRLRSYRKVARQLPFFPLFGPQEAQIPLIPVDVVADWLAAMVSAPTPHPLRAYHLVSQEALPVEEVVRASLRAFGLPLPVRRVPTLPGLQQLLPLLGIPAEAMAYMKSELVCSRDHIEEDFPNLQAPTLQEYLPRIIEGAKEMFK